MLPWRCLARYRLGHLRPFLTSSRWREENEKQASRESLSNGCQTYVKERGRDEQRDVVMNSWQSRWGGRLGRVRVWGLMVGRNVIVVLGPVLFHNTVTKETCLAAERCMPVLV